MNRLNFIVLLRAVACLGVLFHHLFLVANPHPSIILQHFLSHGNTGVIMFFIISGFVILMSLEKLNIKEFIIHRIFRIYPALFVVSALSLLVYFTHRSSINFDGNYINLIPNLLLLSDFIPASGLFAIPSWTLIIEIKFYLICLVFFFFCKKIDLKHIIIYSIVGYLITLGLIDYLIKNGDHFWVDGNTTFRNISLSSFANQFSSFKFFKIQMSIFLVKTISFTIIMFIGSVAYLHYTNRIDAITMILSIVLLLFLSNILRFENNIAIAKEYIMPMVVFILLYLNAPNIKLPKFVIFLADISYSMYLSHNLVAQTMFPNFYSGNIENRNICAVLVIICTIFVSWLLFKYIEKPAINFSKKLFIK
ncbi:MAG: acyltransferase [Rickettsiales bacterium]|nr:acyltransferase [Rickettsiales bacterium]